MKKPRKTASKSRAAKPELPPEGDMGLGQAERIELAAPMPSVRENGTEEMPDPAAMMADVPIDLPAPEEPMMEGDGPLEIPLEDGGVMLDYGSNMPGFDDLPHNANLAEFLDLTEMGAIVDELLEGIEADKQSRQGWMDDYTEGLKLLAVKVKEPKSADGAAGVSNFRHPLLLEACLRFQANSRAELLPSTGPVKVKNDGVETGVTDDQAKVLEEWFNFYLTKTATEYVPDTNRLLFKVGFAGLGYKKIYTCPLRRRPVSESVDPKDMIVSNEATDLRNAARITHRIDMKRSTMRRMQLMGVYRDVDLQEPNADPDTIRRKEAEVQGIQATTGRPEDQNYELYECYCELDLPGFEHRDEFGEITGLPLPYRVTLDPHSREVLEIKRNWDEFDPDQQAKIPIVDYRYIDAIGFYSLGLLHILGNTTAGVTAATRMLIDAGQFANFPGGLRAKTKSRDMDNNLRPQPGEFVEVDTGGVPIRNIFMELPYNEPSQALMQLTEYITQVGARLGNVGETQVGEGKQDAPVGTTLALLDAQTKVMSSVHKNLHQAQSREFELLLEEFKADPSALFRGQKNAEQYFDVNMLMQALENVALVPVADPNVPSQLHRMAKAQALMQLAVADPSLFNKYEVAKRILTEIDIGDPDALFAPPQPAQPDPIVQIEQGKLAVKQQETQIKAVKTAAEVQKMAADTDLKRNESIFRLAERMASPGMPAPAAATPMPRPRGGFGG